MTSGYMPSLYQTELHFGPESSVPAQAHADLREQRAGQALELEPLGLGQFVRGSGLYATRSAHAREMFEMVKHFWPPVVFTPHQ